MRNREKTEQKIIRAAVRLIAKDGFKALGVNRLADAAGVDKQLIYRYFGGIDGIIDHIAQDVSFWYGEQPEAKPHKDYGELIVHLVSNYVTTLRTSVMLRQALLWELSDTSETLERLDAARSQMFGEWMMKMKGNLTPPPNVDAQATNALVLGSLHYLALMQQTLGQFAGVGLKTDQDWDRVLRAAEHMIRSSYAPPPGRGRSDDAGDGKIR